MAETGLKARSEKPGLLGRTSVALMSQVDQAEAMEAGACADQRRAVRLELRTDGRAVLPNPGGGEFLLRVGHLLPGPAHLLALGGAFFCFPLYFRKAA